MSVSVCAAVFIAASLGAVSVEGRAGPSPRDDNLACGFTKCPRGSSCQVINRRPRCVTTGSLFILRSKAGMCPLFPCPPPPEWPDRKCVSKCRWDRECPGDEKCCTVCSGCSVCIRPFCGRDQTCPPGQVCRHRPAHCVTTPCPQETCVDSHVDTAGGQGAGQCPLYQCAPPPRPEWPLTGLQSRVCRPDTCTSDRQCPPGTKCCSDCSGCMSCTRPICGQSICPQGQVCRRTRRRCLLPPCPQEQCVNPGSGEDEED